ncbi:hypothetical protein KIL84_008782 [Mauremys mutica]|uniref:Uncharacterized protein n=1 Tax=Mauremys mutica TaxID=74926 RepID=A0A9D3X8C2_9SAUR|nr:hypothetical protein KIL84_008782 [Mauremys mutica]
MGGSGSQAPRFMRKLKRQRVAISNSHDNKTNETLVCDIRDLAARGPGAVTKDRLLLGSMLSPQPPFLHETNDIKTGTAGVSSSPERSRRGPQGSELQPP